MDPLSLLFQKMYIISRDTTLGLGWVGKVRCTLYSTVPKSKAQTDYDMKYCLVYLYVVRLDWIKGLHAGFYRDIVLY